MRIKRCYTPMLMALGIIASVGLALLLALYVNVGVARAGGGGPPPGGCTDSPWGDWCCTEPADDGWCWGPGVSTYFGCDLVRYHVVCAIDRLTWALEPRPMPICQSDYSCVEPTGGDLWLADVCEPNDGFSDNGEMTWDSDYGGPLQIATAPEGPWFEVQVNGPPWVVTEEMMNSFAAMVGLEDWHDLWMRSGGGNPQHVGNAVSTRAGRMAEICGW